MSDTLKEIQGIQPDINSNNLEQFPLIAKQFIYLSEELAKLGANKLEVIEKIGPYIQNAEKLALQAINTQKNVRGELGELMAGIEIGNTLYDNILNYKVATASLKKPTSFLEAVA